MAGLEHVDNTQFLMSVFGGRAPSLDPVDMHEIRFERAGSWVTIRFDLAEFPATLPKAWEKSQHNTVQIELMAVEIHACRLDGWRSPMRGAMSVKRADRLALDFAAEGCRLTIEANYIRVHTVSAYRNGG